MGDYKIEQCDIRAQTKLRNGYPNWWCYTHFSSARGDGGIKLDRCEKAQLPPIKEDERIKITLDDYPGGVGIWGALEAVLDTKRDIPEEKGVHVHLRMVEGGDKSVDRTFKEVYIKAPVASLYNTEEWVKIDDYIAFSYTASVVFERVLKVISCKHCMKIHIDADWFSVHYHRKHFCTYCGRDFIDTEPGISNPVHFLQQIFHEKIAHRAIENVKTKLIINQIDYPGGIQIWGSNPAIIWTATRPEQAGIHIHLFKEKGGLPFSDETYGYVEIDGIVLDPQMLRYYMVQKSFPYLAKYLDSIVCPKCLGEHFDKGDKGLNPHKIHECESCGHIFSDTSKYKSGIVSNPIIACLKKIETNHKFLFKE